MSKCKQCGEKISYLQPQDEICEYCVRQNRYDQLKQVQLINKGHTHHCAMRQTWGDGECECGKKDSI